MDKLPEHPAVVSYDRSLAEVTVDDVIIPYSHAAVDVSPMADEDSVADPHVAFYAAILLNYRVFADHCTEPDRREVPDPRTASDLGLRFSSVATPIEGRPVCEAYSSCRRDPGGEIDEDLVVCGH